MSSFVTKAIATTAAILTFSLGSGAITASAASSDTYRQLNLFGDVFERIRSDYVEEVDDKDMVEAAINGMLTSLDPHSSYLTSKDFENMQIQTRGEFGGLGIEVTMENGIVKVVSPIDDTPADRAGVRAGDYITHLDGEQVMGLTLSEAVEKMRGPVKTTIELTIIRKGEDQPLILEITRDVIKVKSVRYRAEGNIAYVRVTAFNEQTDIGLKEAMKELSKELGPKLEGIVLDLRNNPGGLLDQAIAVSDAFLDQGEIVQTRGRDGRDTQRYNSTRGDLGKGKNIIVLINGGSASASEIVAGALQDHQRAVVVGTKSFGKGSVQTIIPLPGNGALRLTTARYYTPSGRSIQAKGIDPDVIVEQLRLNGAQTITARTSEAALRGHLINPDDPEEKNTGKPANDNKDSGKKKDKSEDKNTGTDDESDEEAEKDSRLEDYQLRYALDLLHGMSVVQAKTGN